MPPSQQPEPNNTNQFTPDPATTPPTPPQPLFQPSVSPQPMQPSVGGLPVTPKSSGKKKLIMIVAVLIVIGAVGATFLLKTKGGNPISAVKDAVTGNKDVVDRSDGTLDLSNLIDTTSSIADQSLKAKLNQQVNLSDGLSYMVSKVERNWASPSKYLVVGAGKEFIKVDIVAGNRDKNNEYYIVDSIFKIKNSAGALQSPEFASADEFPGAFKSQGVAGGKQFTGSLVYEVDKGEVITVLATEEKYDSFGAEAKKTVTVGSEVTLQ